jgi:hypothetical protein
LLANTTLVYTVTANIIGTTGDSLVEDLSNTATVNLPTGLVDADTSNNLATDTDTPSNPGPNLGSWDTIPFNLADGGSVTIALSTPLTGDGGASPDLVYYEWLNGTQVMLDWVLIEISADHTNWDTVFFWGNGAADTNTNVDISNPAIGGAEDDNRNFDPADLYNTSGVTIDIDALGLSGSYPYIRITAPQIGGTYGDNDGVGVDSIQLWYP